MNGKRYIKLIEQEIEWCQSEDGDLVNLSDEYKKGFIKGLRQAQFIINALDKDKSL